MIDLKFTLVAASLAGLLCVDSLSGQTVANLTIQSGNGQVSCRGCTSNPQTLFLPLVLQATDASGTPVANAAITWTIASGIQPGVLLNSGTTTFSGATDATGTSSVTYFELNPPFGNIFQSVFPRTITAF